MGGFQYQRYYRWFTTRFIFIPPSPVSLNPTVPRAESVTLYLESASAEDDYQLDDVALEPWQQDQSWRLEAEADIEALRKREVRISFRGVDARSLTVEVL